MALSAEHLEHHLVNCSHCKLLFPGWQPLHASVVLSDISYIACAHSHQGEVSG